MLSLYLKKLELQGFKSFPEKVSLEFEKGVTVVVGPNGCGKSNIADAIKWVLGEQSMKAIRGSKLEDVIFSGTEFRKSVGFAEVSITLDNTDNILPLEFAEVTITRRVYRSGESEYLINKTPCRLKDINNILLDTGIGRDGYSIIGQGKIDEIVNAKSEGIRSIFEEASGIMKYKVRKEEAEKKLEIIGQNTLRIDDILHELENQLKPLKEQSDTAKRYLDIKDKIKDLEISYFVDIIAKGKDEIKSIEEEYKTTFENKNKIDEKIEQLNKENALKLQTLKNMEVTLDSYKKQYYNIEASYEKAFGELNLNNEKLNNIKNNIKKINSEISKLEQNSISIQDNLKNCERAISELLLKYNETLTYVSQKEELLKEIGSVVDESETLLKVTNEKIAEKLDLHSDKKLQIGNIKAHIENIAARKTGIQQEITKAVEILENENIKIMRQKDTINNLAKEIREKSNLLNVAIEQKKELENELTLKNEKREYLVSEIKSANSKYKILNEMEERLEGYDNAVKKFMETYKNEPALNKGIRGILGRLISVEQRYETAIETALGSSIQNIVTNSEEDAKAAISFLKRNNLGRATFLPITSIKKRFIKDDVVLEAKKTKGFLGIASDFIRCDPDYNGIIAGLLGNVILVETLDSGISLAKKFGYTFKIVSLEGDIISTLGSISGGSKSKHYNMLLSRAREMQELQKDISKYENELRIIEADIKIVALNINNKLKNIEEIQNELKEKEIRNSLCENQFITTKENIENLTSKIEMLKEEYAQILRQEEETIKELGKYEEDQQKIEEDISLLKEIIDNKQMLIKDKLSEKETLFLEVTDSKVLINSYKENIENIKKNMQNLSLDDEKVKKQIQFDKLEKVKYEEEIKSLGKSNCELQNKIKSFNEQKTGKKLEIEHIENEKNSIEKEINNNTAFIEKMRNDIAKLNEELNIMSLRKVKKESEVLAIQNKLWDQYELTYNNAQIYKKDTENLFEMQNRINMYKDQLNEYGYVNINAIYEYEKIYERYTFLNTQKKDMEETVEKLKKIISEMNKKMKEQFLLNFNLINRNFNTVFKELFGGGTASLRLSDNNNVLESEIEIELQLPGKRIQNMMLLSGGEKALASIAFLFSLLMLNPVSFCVLDEIDAALDDANVNRFASYIKRLSAKTQFIIITHKKDTMEISDAMYGITMEEKGVSKIVSLKINKNVMNKNKPYNDERILVI